MERIYLSKISLLLILLVGVMAFLLGAYAQPLVAMYSARAGLIKYPDSTAGRFTLVISPLVKGEKFLLDTQSGKIWQITKSGEQIDNSFVCHRMPLLEEEDRSHALSDKPRLSHAQGDKIKITPRLASEKFSKNKVAKEKL